MAVEKLTIDEIEDNFVLCRTLRHSWDDNPTAEVDSDLFKMSTAVLALRCTRCGTERFDYFAPDLTVFQRYYRYPDKYAMHRPDDLRPSLIGQMMSRSLLIRTHNTGRKVRKVG